MSVSQVNHAEQLRASLMGKLPVPQPASAEVIEVNIGFSNIMHDYADELYFQFETASQKENLPFTREELVTYLKVLLQQRVLNCIGGKAVIRPFDNHRVPAMFAVILEMIGKCEDASTGIILLPKLGKELVDLDVDVDWMYKFNLRLAMFERCGFIFAKGLPKPRNGDFDFMSFEVLEDVVRHMRNDKPESYAVAAAMLSLTGLSTFFGHAVYRVNYGSVVELSLRARDLATPRGG